MSLAGLVDPPDQAGELMKRGHGKWRPWRQRFFVLKASGQGSGPRCRWGGRRVSERPWTTCPRQRSASSREIQTCSHALPSIPPPPTQDSGLYYFRRAGDAQAGRIRAFIPLESARIETEAPPALAGEAPRDWGERM